MRITRSMPSYSQATINLKKEFEKIKNNKNKEDTILKLNNLILQINSLESRIKNNKENFSSRVKELNQLHEDIVAYLDNHNHLFRSAAKSKKVTPRCLFPEV